MNNPDFAVINTNVIDFYLADVYEIRTRTSLFCVFVKKKKFFVLLGYKIE